MKYTYLIILFLSTKLCAGDALFHYEMASHHLLQKIKALKIGMRKEEVHEKLKNTLLLNKDRQELYKSLPKLNHFFTNYSEGELILIKYYFIGKPAQKYHLTSAMDGVANTKLTVSDNVRINELRRIQILSLKNADSSD